MTVAAAPLQYLTTSGTHADPVTALTWGLIWLSVSVVIIITLAVAGAIAFRRAPTAGAASLAPDRGGRGMWWIYIGIPLTAAALIAALFWTMRVMAAVDAPAHSPRLTLEVTGRQWWWEVHYLPSAGAPAVITANEIHIPVGEPVLVRLKGGDVIHSFWVPALAGKTDTIPGRINLTWLQASSPGIYFGQCTEFCGMQHANMGFRVIADPPAEFERWRRAQASPAPVPEGLAANGAAIFQKHCSKCHEIAGTAAHGKKGPDLTHLMSRSTIAAGLMPNNVNTLSGWISDPQAQKPGAHMPPTWLSGPELQSVVTYLETMK